MDFVWVGNHPGIDLCNTLPVVDGGSIDLLSQPADLDRWLKEAKITRQHVHAGCDASTLVWVHRLRAALTDVLTAGAERSFRLKALNELLTDKAFPVIGAQGELELLSDDQQRQIRLDLTRTAAGAIALDPTRVRRCAGKQCVLLFFDTSRSGTRRWHDMATCGNRAKAAAHHARINL